MPVLRTIYCFFQEHPDLIKDQFWDDLYPEIPYTAAAEEKRGPDPVIGAAANIEVKYSAYIVRAHQIPY